MIVEILVAALLVIGGLFGAIGAWGLVRLPDPMTRMHGPTKAATLGVGAVLIASMLRFWGQGQFTWHELLISIFVFITAPVAALFLAKANMALLWQEKELPDPSKGKGGHWATYMPRSDGKPPENPLPPGWGN